MGTQRNIFTQQQLQLLVAQIVRANDKAIGNGFTNEDIKQLETNLQNANQDPLAMYEQLEEYLRPVMLEWVKQSAMDKPTMDSFTWLIIGNLDIIMNLALNFGIEELDTPTEVLTQNKLG